MAIETTFTLKRHQSGNDLIVQIGNERVTKREDGGKTFTKIAPKAKIFGAANGETDWWIYLDFDEVEAIYQAMVKAKTA